ncbi:MAG: protein kinase [Chloroflexi bacterium]|uniref:WD40 repeat domain-containing serine/threonine protein kinase n=1 Tax=Candidatus Flexifilum breve TaxID=3140694 RepID=UPI0031354198|nr:protein kinase [Chloroflexota bacterium]
MTEETKRVIKGYELREKIGAGGFGAVYRAAQPAVGREVAIKVILAEHANQPEFIRRFETEAQLVARLEHPHIVPLYDYWREPDGAYLVMRFLRGGSLRASIRAGGPWQPESTSLMLDQVAAALTVAHRSGVIHRDLKPDNILLDEEGNAYLADFGIAKDLSTGDAPRTAQVIGSPDYMSPEQVRGETLTPASDIYSLGIVLYETLTGVRPFPDNTATALMLKQLNDPLPPVSMKRPDLPEEVDDVIAQATEKDPAKRFKDAVALAVAFRRAVGLTSALSMTDALAARQGGPATEMVTEEANLRTVGPLITGPSTPATAGSTNAPVRNPFKGLRAFQSADAADFFGRDALINTLLSRLNAEGDTSRFLAVVGPSGSGKSSVVKAGLLPKIRAGALEGSDRWFIVEMTPGARPFEELEIALLRIAVNPPTSLMEQMQADERGLLRAVSRVLPSADSTLVLVIDQFEEVFTQLENEAVRRQFLTSLLTAIQESRGNLRVIMTLRADFYDKPLLYADFGHLFRRCTEVVLPLNREELNEAITKPARMANLNLEPGLVEAITKDVGEQPGALPLLQYALTELYQRRRGNLLTLDAYHEINGAMGALARRAEQTFLELDETCQKAARQIFLRLVTLGEGTEDTRRRVRQDELMSLTAADNTAVQNVLDTYGKYRLLTFDRDPLTRVPTVEVAHEALIRSWDRLKSWLNTSRESMRLQRGLALAAEEWRRNNRDAGYLMSGTRLSQFEEWAAGTDVALSAEERAYLEASLTERERVDAAEAERKRREALIARRAQNFGRAAVVLGVVGVLAVVATILAFVQANSASQQVATATVAQGLAIFDQQTAVAQGVTAQAQVAVVAQTLTPVAPTLTAVGGTLEAGNQQLATAAAAQEEARDIAATAGANADFANQTLTPIPATLTAVGEQLAAGVMQLSTATAAYGEAIAQVVEAQEQAANVAATLTPVGPTLTAVGATLEAGNQQLATAAAAQFQAEALAGTAQAQSVEIAALLTPVPVTLTAVAQQVERGETRAEALRLVSEGNALLQGEDGNAELAAMLSIRALNIEYQPLADDVLVAASNRLFTRQMFGDNSTVNWYASLSPDGRLAVTAGGDSALRVYDASNGMLLRTIPGPNTPWSVVFSPDGQTILAGFGGGSAIIYDTATGEEIREFSGHDDAVFSAAFSADGARIVTGSADNTAMIWEVATGRRLETLTGHVNMIYNVAFSPDGTKVATASRDTSAKIWDANTGEILFNLFGHTNSVYGVAFSPNGRFLLTGGYDDVALLWDVATGRELRRLEGHTSGILNVAFSPDGRTVATVSEDRTARLWDIERRTEIRRLTGHTDSIWSVNFSHDGRFVITASSDGTSRLWDASPAFVPHQFLGHTGELLAIDVSPDGRVIATGGDDNTVRLWDRETSEQIAQLNHPGWVRSVTFSPDGRLLATGSDDNAVRVFDAATGIELVSMGSRQGVVYDVDWSGDGTRLVAAYEGGLVTVWDALTGAAIFTVDSGGTSANASAYAPDGQTFAAGTNDGSVVLWDAVTGTQLAIFSGHENTVFALDYTADSRYLWSSSGDTTIRKWDVQTGENVLRITGHTGTIWSLMAALDNQYVVSSSSDNTVRLWNAQTGAELRRFSGHTGAVWGVAMTDDSRFVLSASRDGSARLWDVNVDDTISYVCSRLRREFTAAEREQFQIFDQQPTCPQFAPVSVIVLPTATAVVTLAPTSTLPPVFATEVAQAAVADLAALDINRDAVRVFGPAGGALAHNPTSSSVVQSAAPVSVLDFVAQVSFTVPYRGDWDFAYFFRQNDSGHYRLIVDSNRDYALIRYDVSTGTLTDPLKSGRVEGVWNTNEGETNTLQLIVINDKADLYANGEYVTRFEVGDRTSAGSVSVVTAAYDGYSRTGAVTLFDDFTVWSLDQQAATVIGAPSWTPIPEYATLAAFSGTATYIAPTQIAQARATAEAVSAGSVPIFGPMNGSLVHEADSAANVSAFVQPADFVAEVRFYNPYGRARGDWDFALDFRFNDDGSHSLVIGSDLVWEFETQVGDRQSSVSGQLTNLNISEGGANTLRVVAQGASGAFYLNGEFITTLDLSSNVAPGEIAVVAGYYDGYRAVGEVTRFEDFTIWSPLNVAITPTPPPAVEATAQRGQNAGSLTIGTRDSWTYTARGGEIIDLYTEAEWDTVLALIAPDGRILALNDDSVRGGLTSLIERFTFPIAGDYRIEVRGYADEEGGAYKLWIIDPPAATPTPSPEPTVPPAGTLEIGSNGGEIAIGDGDVWLFEGRAGQTITFDIDASWDTTLTIYRENGLVLAANDDDPGGGTSSYIEELVLPATEIYRVEVRSYNDQSGGRYVLKLIES